jgi:Zn-dependent protease with chaperone function
MIPIAGQFFFHKSSRQQTATLTITDDGQVEVVDANNQSLVSTTHLLTELEISPRLGNTPRHIQFQNGDRFETLDNDGIDQLLKQNQHGLLYRILHQLESHLAFVLIVTLITGVGVWGFVKFGVPASASLIAQLLPAETSQYLGKGTLDIMDKSVFEPSELEPQRQQELREKFILLATPYKKYSVNVQFRKSEEIGANAMALPDGTIIFTDDMVNLAQQDDELIAVFGHEVGHLAHRHMLRRVIQDSMFSVVLVLVTGDVSSVSSIVTAIPGVLLELAYSRKFEQEADDFAYDFLLQNNIPPANFAYIMRRLEAQHHDDKGLEADKKQSEKSETDYRSYLSTHPATEERIKKFLQTGKDT